MPRSPKDDPRYNDTWNFGAESAEKCAPNNLNDRKQTPISSNSNVMNENSMYVNAKFGNDMYASKLSYNVLAGETAANKEEKIGFANMPNIPQVNLQNYSNATLNWGDGQSLKVYVHYDENGQPRIVPMTGQYELFNHNQGLREIPLQPQPSPIYAMNQDYGTNNNVHLPTPMQNNYCQDNVSEPNNKPTSNFLKDLLGNLEPNSTGTYSPFGQNYPLNHPDVPTLNMLSNPVMETKAQAMKVESSPKRNENSPLADTSNKKRIVAEVKPMRPTYSDVLAKNTKNISQPEATHKVKPQNIDIKPSNNKSNSKPDKPNNNIKHNDDNKHKTEKKHQNSTISSGSESGDLNTDDAEKPQKPNKKSKNKRGNISRKWSSLDDITNEEDGSYDHSNESQFVFIENQEKPKKEKKNHKTKTNKNVVVEDEIRVDEEDQSEFVFQENQAEALKSKKKKETRNYHKISKPIQDKKKTSQCKVRRNKPGYLGLAQNYLEHWGGATWKALVWFAYLLSDICRMSLHLSFDL